MGPYGDIMTDDHGLRSYLKDRSGHFKIACFMRNVKTRKMCRKKFDLWKESLFKMDPDESLRKYI